MPIAHSEVSQRQMPAVCSLIDTAKLNNPDPNALLHDVLSRITNHPNQKTLALKPRGITR
jgi:hypothetical protein